MKLSLLAAISVTNPFCESLVRRLKATAGITHHFIDELRVPGSSIRPGGGFNLLLERKAERFKAV